MTLYLLKVHLQTSLSTPVSQKCQILSCDTLVANGRYKGKGKGKAIPLHAWTGPEGSRRLRFPDFKKVGT
jgi:hypothetical protein